jgi:hypothetical protein
MSSVNRSMIEEVAPGITTKGGIDEFFFRYPISIDSIVAVNGFWHGSCMQSSGGTPIPHDRLASVRWVVSDVSLPVRLSVLAEGNSKVPTFHSSSDTSSAQGEVIGAEAYLLQLDYDSIKP